jgi:alkylation response protein AidB-like acyl-CoA dehydrogenase
MGESHEAAQEIARTARRAAEAAAGLEPAAAARRLGEDGLLGVLAPEAVGGLALPLSAAAPVVAAAEAALVPVPLVEALLAARLLAERQPDIAAAVVAGEAICTAAGAGALRSTGGRVAGVVGRAPLGAAARWLIAPVEGGGAALLDLSAPGVAAEEERGLDLERPVARVAVDGAAAAALLPEDAALSAFRADALLLRAAGALGAAEHCMGRAIEHVTGRRQFGRPLVLFQGLRFELARHKLALEGARAALAHALSVAGQDPRGEGVARLVARSACAEAAPLVIEGAIQLHGGMGFTWDLGLHRQLRRAKDAAAALDAVAARAALADRLEQAWAS